jgi:hypothetical protein
VAGEAASHGWPVAMAHHYLTNLLHFPLDMSPGSLQRRAMESFHSRAFDLRLIPRLRPLELYGS